MAKKETKTEETKKETTNNIHEVVVKIEGEDWTKALDVAFAKRQKTTKVDGFRAGKVPRDVYEKKFGKESLFIDAADASLQLAYIKAMEESKLIPVVQPEVADPNSNTGTGKAGFANSKFFMVVAVAFFLASCIFLGYEVFNYFQLIK